MSMSVALYGLTNEQKKQVTDAAILGADFEQETDDWDAADFGFYWIDGEECDASPRRLAVAMLELGRAVVHQRDIWVASNVDVNEHTALCVVNMVAQTVQPFDNPVDALHWFIVRYLRTMPYREYLQTTHWGMLRHFARERAGGRCQLCNTSDSPLHTHHRTYERRGDEWPEDLIVLCANCHATFHNKLPKGGD